MFEANNNSNRNKNQQSYSFLRINPETNIYNDNETNISNNNNVNTDNAKYKNLSNIKNNENTDDNQNQIFIKQNSICQICKVKDSIYKCPRCQIKSCSLGCVKEHKRIYKCSGIRDKFSKKSIKDFTENDYVRDMNFINTTLNESNRIAKKVFCLMDEDPTELVNIYNSSKVNSGISAFAGGRAGNDALNLKNTTGNNEIVCVKENTAEKLDFDCNISREEAKSFVKDGKFILVKFIKLNFFFFT